MRSFRAGIHAIVVGLCLALWMHAGLAAAAAPVDPTATPVLLELFTSEACGKCPPADSLLAGLLETQPIDGAQIIAIAAHVNSGRPEWSDRFANPSNDERQRMYAALLSRGTIYTPQLIIDGSIDVLGYSRARVRNAIQRASGQPKPLALSIAANPTGSGTAGDSVTVRITIRPQGASAGASSSGDIFLAVVENDLATNVTAGENAGRHLDHVAVLRSLARVGDYAAGGPAPAVHTLGVRLLPTWKRDRLHAVAFVQAPEADGRRVLGVAELRDFLRIAD